MIIQTLGGLVDLAPDWRPSMSYGSIPIYEGLSIEYGEIYRVHTNVRTAVGFLARNIAQLGLHVFRRISDTDRVRLTDHPFAALLAEPNPSTTRYRLFDSLITDLCIYGDAYWIKIDKPRAAVVRVPPQNVTVRGNLVPASYEIAIAGREPMNVKPEGLVHFRTHNPHSSVVGLSPLESLRQLLIEDVAATEFRAEFWRNNARIGGVITRPREAPDWTNEARVRFRSQWESMFSGARNAGRTAILEDGMQFQSSTMSATDAQYIDARKLTREEVAAAFHIPPALIGIMDQANFSNMQEQHRHLYTDTLGPWLAMVEDEIELQLLPDFESEQVYVEFNLSEKLKGSFEEQAKAFSTMVGAPMMTRSEARARLNLPRIEDADGLVVPLNVLVGGQASPQDSVPELASLPRLVDAHAERWAGVLKHFYDRQGAAVLSRKAFDAARWNRELADDLGNLGRATATKAAGAVAEAIGAAVDEPAIADRIAAWAADEAALLNGELAAELAGGMDRGVFERAGQRTPDVATRLAAEAARIGATVAAGAGGA